MIQFILKTQNLSCRFYKTAVNYKMLSDCTLRLWTQCKLLARLAYSWTRAVLLAARDPSKLWACGINVVLKQASIVFVAPFTLAISQDGLRTLRIATRSHQFMSFVWNIVFGLRMAFLTCISFDGDFKWFICGQLTPDASFFCVWLMLFFVTYTAHMVLFYQADDLVFLCNVASRMDKSFSSMLRRAQ